MQIVNLSTLSRSKNDSRYHLSSSLKHVYMLHFGVFVHPFFNLYENPAYHHVLLFETLLPSQIPDLPIDHKTSSALHTDNLKLV